MDKKLMFKTVDQFLEDMHKHGTSNVTCPKCGKKLEIIGNTSAYVVKCQTDNCLKESFRGI